MNLSVEEELELISQLWDSIEPSTAAPTLSETQSAELRRRRAEGLRDPATMVDWSEVRNDLFKKS